MIPALNPITIATQALSTLTGAGADKSAVGSSSAALSPATASTSPSPFSDLLVDAVGQVNKLEEQAHAAVTGLMTGSGVDVHQAMIATQKESMAFELALAVRNKAVAAYQQVIGMQF
jgi:flagellar hook-basal body complex protein FliE